MTFLQMAVAGFEVLCALYLLWCAVVQLTHHSARTWYAVSLSWVLVGGYGMWVVTGALYGKVPQVERSLLLFVVTLALVSDRRKVPRVGGSWRDVMFGRRQNDGKRPR